MIFLNLSVFLSGGRGKLCWGTKQKGFPQYSSAEVTDCGVDKPKLLLTRLRECSNSSLCLSGGREMKPTEDSSFSCLVLAVKCGRGVSICSAAVFKGMPEVSKLFVTGVNFRHVFHELTKCAKLRVFTGF